MDNEKIKIEAHLETDLHGVKKEAVKLIVESMTRCFPERVEFENKLIKKARQEGHTKGVEDTFDYMEEMGINFSRIEVCLFVLKKHGIELNFKSPSGDSLRSGVEKLK